MDSDKEKSYILCAYESDNSDFSLQILVQEGKLVVYEDKKDEGVEPDYEFLLMHLVELLNDKISYQFMNENGHIGLGNFLIERKAKLN